MSIGIKQGVTRPALALVKRLSMLILLIMLPPLIQSSSAAPGTVNLELAMGELQGAGWSARGVRLGFELNASDQVGLELEIDEMRMPGRIGVLKHLRIACPGLQIGSDHIQCPQGAVRVDHPVIDPVTFPIQFSYRSAGEARVSIAEVPVAQGKLSMHLGWQDAHWFVNAQGKGLTAEELLDLLEESSVSFDMAISGKLDFSLRGNGDAIGLQALKLVATAAAVGFTDDASRYVGEDIDLEVMANAARIKDGWSFNSDLKLNRGQLYLDPVFLEVDHGQSLKVIGSGRWFEDKNIVKFDSIRYNHPGILQMVGRAELRIEPGLQPSSGTLNIVNARFPEVYHHYLQPFAIGTVMDDLDTTGKVSGTLDYQGGEVDSLDLRMSDLSFQDRQNRFAIHNLKGEIHWRNNAKPLPSRLGFDGGTFYRIGLGTTKLMIESKGRNLHLLQPAVIPVLDGRLKVESFDLQDAGTEALSWRFDAGLSPVSIEALTEAVDWPLMAGRLSGMVPDVSYSKGRLIVDGALLVRVLDGHVVINNLRMQAPFGPVPQLTADVDIDRIDLEALTRTFSFGRIDGRLNGRIHALKLLDWQPVHFDAKFFTPEGDRSRHRISQRAVDNLTSLGGGVSGALSSGFLRLFKNFSYSRIGLSCLLNNGVCDMDGVAPAEGEGYYIVKGAGLPRIDIIGYRHRVDWFELVQRLKAVNLEQGPVVQ
ncbi:MAG: hypothetical protein ABFS45_05850 [Pseudomonadota bacterium]